MNLVLASQSPRRSLLLKQLDLNFMVVPSTEEEKLIEGLLPEELVLALARRKAWNVAKKVKDSIIIAADTVVVWNKMILGKPQNRQEAQEMLQNLSGQTHQVMTGLVLLRQHDQLLKQFCEKSEVVFRSLSQEEITAYLDTAEYFDKAGGYAIQGKAAIFVEKICGCYFNIVGLPLHRLILLLREMGENVV